MHTQNVRQEIIATMKTVKPLNTFFDQFAICPISFEIYISFHSNYLQSKVNKRNTKNSVKYVQG